MSQLRWTTAAPPALSLAIFLWFLAKVTVKHISEGFYKNPHSLKKQRTRKSPVDFHPPDPNDIIAHHEDIFSMLCSDVAECIYLV